ncbi:MAG: hypothetical protein ACOC3V_02715 [bacterium]
MTILEKYRYNDDIIDICVDNKDFNKGEIKILFKCGQELFFTFDLTHSLSSINDTIEEEIIYFYKKIERCKKLKKIKECLEM